VQTFRIAIVLGLGAITVGCAGETSEEETTGQSAGALNLAAAPAPAERQIIRAKSPGCGAVGGTGGSWTGAAITTPVGASRDFCTYRWVATARGTPADDGALAAAAVTDTSRWNKKPYVVTDVRPTNAPAVHAPLGGDGSILWNPGAASSSGAPPSNLAFGGLAPTTIGGAGARPASASGGLTIGRHTDPDGLPGCDVCGGDLGNGYLVFVLPPEALDAPTISLETAGGTYDVGPISTPVFYTAAPPLYSGWLHVSWY
jgi:hypothetical protein